MAKDDPAAVVKSAYNKGLIEKDEARRVLDLAKGGEGSPEDLLVREGLMTQHTVDRLKREAAKAQGPMEIAGYRIIAKLGQGGMGAVYKAIQKSVDREVALKVISKSLMADKEIGERFLREGRAAGKVNHPNVITLHDVGRDRGRLYMALELVTGGDADQLAEQHGGVLPEKRAVEIIRDASKGLEAIHAAGLLHRDIKPANILLAEDGTGKLADLGLARTEDGDDRLTMTGTTIGTPAFMSPEQASGEKDIDIRSDIYALGATLFALVCGRAPYSGANAFSIVAQVIHDPTPDPRSINRDLTPAIAKLIMRAMHKDPGKRHQEPRELTEALQAVLPKARDAAPALALATDPTLVTAQPTTPTPLSNNDKGVMIGLAAAFGALLLIGLLVWAPWSGGDAAPPDRGDDLAATDYTPPVRGADGNGDDGDPGLPPDDEEGSGTDGPPPGPDDREPPPRDPVDGNDRGDPDDPGHREPPPPPGDLPPGDEPMLAAIDLSVPDFARSLRDYRASPYGRLLDRPSMKDFRQPVVDGIARAGTTLRMPLAEMIAGLGSISARLPADPRFEPGDGGEHPLLLEVASPDHADRIWRTLALFAETPPETPVLHHGGNVYLRDGERLRAALNVDAHPPLTERWFRRPDEIEASRRDRVDLDCAVRVGSLAAMAQERGGRVDRHLVDLLHRLDFEFNLALDAAGSEEEIFVNAMGHLFEPIEVRALAGAPSDPAAIAVVGLRGEGILELLEIADMLDGGGHLEGWQRESARARLPDPVRALRSWRGTAWAALLPGRGRPDIVLSFPSSPEFDPHLAGMFGLAPHDLPQAERAVIPIGHWGPWPLNVTRKGDAWYVASDAAWLERLLALRRPLRPRLAGLLGELIRSRVPERGATPPAGVVRFDAAETFAAAADLVTAMREHVDPVARLPLAAANRMFTDAGAILPDTTILIETRPDDHHGVEIHGENLLAPLLIPVVFGWLDERGAVPIEEDAPRDAERDLRRPPPDADRRPRDDRRFRPPRGDRRR